MISSNSLGAALLNSSQQHAERTALLYKIDNWYQSISYQELRHFAFRLAGYLLEIGVKPGDRVAIISCNRPEWAVVDFACLLIGAVLVPIYPSLSVSQVQYMIADSGARLVFAERDKQARKVSDLLSARKIQKVMVLEPSETYHSIQILARPGVSRTAHFDSEIIKVCDNIQRKDLATIIYTSGTTGAPKGVMLTHGNLLANAESVLQVIPVSQDDRVLSILPLAHILERLGGQYAPLLQGASIAYAESAATIARNIIEVKPTFMVAVPRLFEMMHNRILKTVERGPNWKRSLFYWSLGTVSQRNSGKKKLGLMPTMRRFIANQLVFKKIRVSTGGRIRFFISGGAALNQNVAKFFETVGLPILEGYGLTETSPVLCVNPPEDNRYGTVGRPLPGVQIRITPDGEILAKGDNIMQGYYKLPGETKKAFDKNGFFKTGDLGHFDERGFLVISGRKKDIIVTSKGKNVAPVSIENLLKSSPYISEAMVIGDERPFLSAMIVPNLEQLQEKGIKIDQSNDQSAEIIENSEVINLLRAEIRRLSAELADFEQIKKFFLLGRELSIENEELTPSLKIRREVLAKQFAKQIDSMYEAYTKPVKIPILSKILSKKHT